MISQESTITFGQQGSGKGYALRQHLVAQLRSLESIPVTPGTEQERIDSMTDQPEAERLAQVILTDRYGITDPTPEELAFATQQVLSNLPGARCVAGEADFGDLSPDHQDQARRYRGDRFYLAQ